MAKNHNILGGVLFGICIALIIAISGATTLYGDDFIYGTYGLDGLKRFIDLNVAHYMTYNGRAFVHIALQVVLLFKDTLFFAVIPGLLMGAFAAFYNAFDEDYKNTSRLDFFTLCLAGVMCISVKTLREGMLWMSGAMNYIFPLIFTYLSFYILKKTDEKGKCRRYYYILAFFCGATTEQGGAMSLVLAFLYIFYYSIRNKRMVSRRVIALAGVILLGYISIYLSPATSKRLLYEGVEQQMSIDQRCELLFGFAYKKNGALWIFALCEALMLFELGKKKKYVAVIGALIAAASIYMAMFRLGIAGGLCLAALMLVTAAAMMILNTCPNLAMAVICAGAGMFIMVTSTTFGFRNILPTYFTLIAVCAAIIAQNLSKRPKALAGIVSLGIVIISVIVFRPTLSGYLENRKTINENIAAYKNSEEIYYNLNVKNPYRYFQYFEIGIYEGGLKKIYNIPDDAKIYLTGRDYEVYYCNGCACLPKIYDGGKKYFPMRGVLEAHRGEVYYNEITRKTKIRLDGVEYEFDNEKTVFTKGSEEIDMSDKRLCDEEYRMFYQSNTYFPQEVFEEVFGLEIE